jgi:hypothetical protein
MVDPAPGKSCGSCTACCKVVAVDELQKPGGVDCVHCEVGRGCKIYLQRPSSCRTYVCGWLVNPHLGSELKPDRCHVVLTWWHEGRVLFADCDPDWPDAWRAPNVISVLREAATKVAREWKVVAAVGRRTWLITGHAILSDTGEVTPFAERAAVSPD